PGSPADKAGLKAGDRVLKVGPGDADVKRLRPVANRDQLLGQVDQAGPGTEVKLEVRHKEGGKVEAVSVTLGRLPEAGPDTLPLPATKKKALAAAGAVRGDKKPETGLIERKNALGREYWAYVPENYDPDVAHGVVIWLHPTGRGKEPRDLIDVWLTACEDQ